MTTGDAVDPTAISPSRQADNDAAYSQLWRTVKDLAQVWAEGPLIRHFAAVLPRNAAPGSAGITGLLQEMEAAGADISEHPLRMIPTIQLMLRQPSLPGRPRPIGWSSWLEAAEHVEVAHRLTVAWVRSRLSGYPDLPAPQLAAGTPLTIDEANEFSDQLIWLPQEPSPDFSVPDPPAAISVLLQATPAQQRAIEDGTRALVEAFERTEEWLRLADATAALTDSARADLRNAHETVARRLRTSEVNQHSSLVLARFNYRVTVLNDVLGGLSGPAREYATAFGAANKLIEISSDVFGETTCYGPPTCLSRPSNIDLRPGTLQLVSFTRSDPQSGFFDLDIGQIVWLEDPLVPDAVRLMGSTTTFDQSFVTERWTGRMLTGSSDAWRSQPWAS